MSAWAIEGLILSWQQMGKKSYGARVLRRVSSAYHTVHLFTFHKGPRAYKSKFRFCLCLKSSMAMGQVHEIGKNPHLLRSYEVLLIKDNETLSLQCLLVSFPVLIISFFSPFHFLSFNVLPQWVDPGAMVGLRLCMCIGVPEIQKDGDFCHLCQSQMLSALKSILHNYTSSGTTLYM